MSDLRELYQELILDHGKRPRNFRFPEGANRQAEGHNPLCGDRLVLKVKEAGEVIEDIGFLGQGCAICMASASTMSERVKGLSCEEARALVGRFQKLVKGEEQAGEDLGKLAAFSGVAAFPLRVKCATLAWHTLDAALTAKDRISTEQDDG